MNLVFGFIVRVFVVWMLLGVVTVGLINRAKLLVRSSARRAEAASLHVLVPAAVGCGQGGLPAGSVPRVPAVGATQGGAGTWPPPLVGTARGAA